MSNQQQVREVAMREIRTRGRSRGFRAITLLMLLLAIAAPIVLAFLPSPGEDSRTATIGLATETPAGLADAIVALSDDVYELTFLNADTTEGFDIDQLLEDGEADVVFEPPNQLVWAETADSSLASLIGAAFNQVTALARAEALGLDIDAMIEVFTPTELKPRYLAESTNTEELRQAVAFFGLFLAFLLPQIFGQLTMLSVIEEKSTRVVEVLLSHIRPRTLLVGKILGICALAVVQLTLLLIGLFGSLIATSVVSVPASVWRFVPMLGLSVAGGLAIYTTLFALLGSLISRQEDAAQVMMPVFGPLMVGYFVGQSAVFGNAEAIWARVLTWFPLTTPMLLPVRVARGAIGPLETVLSLGGLALATWLLVRLASRVYEFTLLRTGSRVGWAELIRLSRGAIAD